MSKTLVEPTVHFLENSLIPFPNPVTPEDLVFLKHTIKDVYSRWSWVGDGWLPDSTGHYLRLEGGKVENISPEED